MSVADILSTAKNAGFEAVELTLEASGEITLETSVDDLKRIKETADDLGMLLPTVATGLNWQFPLVGPDPALCAKGVQVTKKCLEVAKVFGAQTVLAVPCTVTPDFPYDVAYDRCVELFRGELGDAAEAAGVYIGIEYVWNKFLLSPLEFRNMLDEIGRKFVAAYFDVGNVLNSGYPEQWIRILGSRIKAVHFKDFRCSVGTIPGFVDLLEGDVAWDRVMAAFAEIGYDFAVAAEMMPPYANFPLRLIDFTSLAMDSILGRA
jgi:hexulose-6-phosphate isomerase